MEEVFIGFEDGTSRTFPIGTWHLERAEHLDPTLQPKEYIAVYPDIDSGMTFTAQNSTGETIGVGIPDLGLSTLTVSHVTINGEPVAVNSTVEVPPDGTVTFTLTLDSDGKYDFFMTSPTVPVTVGDNTTVALFEPAMFGILDITETELAGFASN